MAIDPNNIEKTTKLIQQLELQLKAFTEKLEEQYELNIDTSTVERLEETIKSTLTLNTNVVDLQQRSLDNMIEKLRLENEILDLTKEQEKTKFTQNTLDIERLEKLKNQTDIIKEQAESSEALLKSSLGIKDNAMVYGGKLQQIKNLSQLTLDADKQRVLQQQFIASTITSMIDGVSRLSQFFINMALDVEKAAKNLMQFANFSFEEASRGITQAGVSAAIAGIPLENLVNAMSTLKKEFSDYTELTEDQRSELNNFAAIMDKIGVNASTQAMIFNTTTKSLGISTEQTKGFISSLKDFATETGQTVQMLDRQLSSSANQLAKYGDQFTSVFRSMSAASKQLGMDMNEMFNITERFTTFEGAAEAAAKLNALLGRDVLNSIDLLNASMNNPIEAFKMFKQALDASGISFNELDNGMRRTMAAAVGMSEIQAGKAFSQDINLSVAALQEQQKTTEQLALVSSEMTSIMDKFKNAMLALYPIIKPIVNAIGSFADFLTNTIGPIVQAAEKNKELVFVLKSLAVVLTVVASGISLIGIVVVPLATIIVSLGVLFGGLSLQSFTLAGLLKSLGVSFGSTGTGALSSIPGITTWTTTTATAGTAAAAASPSFWSIAAAILAIGLAVTGILFGMAELVKSFAQVGENALYALGGLLAATAGIVGLGFALASLSGIGAAGAFVLLGVAVSAAMIASSIKSASDSLAEMFVKINPTIVALKELVEQLDKIDIKKLEVLGKIGGVSVSPSMQTAAAPVMEFRVGNSSQSGGAENTASTSMAQGKEQNSINVTIKIDSPIMLDKTKLGNFTTEKTTSLLASLRTPGLAPAIG